MRFISIHEILRHFRILKSKVCPTFSNELFVFARLLELLLVVLTDFKSNKIDLKLLYAAHLLQLFYIEREPEKSLEMWKKTGERNGSKKALGGQREREREK